MLILTDYIKKENTIKIATEDSFKSISVVSVFEVIRRFREDISLAVLSGTLVILNAKILTNLDSLCEVENVKYDKELINNTDYYIIKFIGTSKHKVKIISELFAKGLIKILIGTKSLLGEGWDSPCINSLILASFVGSFVVSNQMRGRAIRVDKNTPQKSANIWHLVTVEPDYFFQDNILKRITAKLTESNKVIKSYDYDTLERRFNCFVGPTYHTNDIESGIERLSVIKPPFDRAGIIKINEEMIKLSNNRNALIQKWNDALIKSAKLSIVNEVPKDRRINPYTFQNMLMLSLIIGSEGALTYSIISNITRLSDLNIFQIIIMIIALTTIMFYSKKFIYKIISHLTPARSIKNLANCILKTLKDINLVTTASHVLVKKDEIGLFIQTTLVNATIHEQNIFNKAIQELLSPIENPRYIIIKKWWFAYDYTNSFACPTVIAKKKEYVEIFESYLKRSLGKIELIYTRNENGRKIILKSRKRSYITHNGIALGILKKVKKWE